MGFYKKPQDKTSDDGLALTEWNDLSNAVAGNSGLTLALESTDKVGIGIKNPAEKLHIKGGGLLVRRENSDGAANIGVFRGISNNQGIGIGKNCIEAIGSNTNQDILLKPKGTGKLTVNGNAEVNGDVTVTGNVEATNFIGDGSQLTNLSVGLTGLNLATESGNVGIGTSSPEAKLHINGGALRVESSGNNDETNIGEFLSNAGGQGIGIGKNGIEAIGSNTHQNILLKPKGDGKITVDGNLRVLGSIGSSQIGSSKGYQKLGTFMIQWGKVQSTSNDAQEFTFKTSFNTKCYSITATWIDLEGGGDNVRSKPISVHSINKNGFTVDRDNSINNTPSFYFIAVGDCEPNFSG